MVTVTYRQLERMAIDYPEVVSKIHTIFGGIGLDTPINVLDIIENAGLYISLYECLLTLLYAPDALAVSQVISIECLRNSMAPWDYVFPGDSRLRDFLQNIEVYMATGGVPGTPKKDYCGDDVPGFYGTLPASQLIADYASIKASADALTLVGVPYSRSYWMTQGGLFTQAAIDYWTGEWTAQHWTIDAQDRNSTDPVTIHAASLSSYIEHNIAASLAADPDFYLKESAQFDAQTPSGGTYYGVIVHRLIDGGFPNGSADLINYMNQSVKIMVNNVWEILLESIYNVNLLPYIADGIKIYMGNYATERRLQLGGAILPRLEQLSTTGVWPNKTHSDPVAASEQAVIDAGLNRRAALMHDLAYLNTFDSNVSGTLSATERANLENDVRAKMRESRKSAASALFAAAQAEYDALPALSENQRLIDIMTPYLL